MKFILWIREQIGTATIKPHEAVQCRKALIDLHTAVHAKFDALETPAQVETRWRQQGLIK